jgi:hypothetical protein
VGRGRWRRIDGEQALVNRDEDEVHRAGLTRLAVALMFELAQAVPWPGLSPRQPQWRSVAGWNPCGRSFQSGNMKRCAWAVLPCPENLSLRLYLAAWRPKSVTVTSRAKTRAPAARGPFRGGPRALRRAAP